MPHLFGDEIRRGAMLINIEPLTPTQKPSGLLKQYRPTDRNAGGGYRYGASNLPLPQQLFYQRRSAGAERSGQKSFAAIAASIPLRAAGKRPNGLEYSPLLSFPE